MAMLKFRKSVNAAHRIPKFRLDVYGQLERDASLRTDGRLIYAVQRDHKYEKSAEEMQENLSFLLRSTLSGSMDCAVHGAKLSRWSLPKDQRGVIPFTLPQIDRLYGQFINYVTVDRNRGLSCWGQRLTSGQNLSAVAYAYRLIGSAVGAICDGYMGLARQAGGDSTFRNSLVVQKAVNAFNEQKNCGNSQYVYQYDLFADDNPNPSGEYRIQFDWMRRSNWNREETAFPRSPIQIIASGYHIGWIDGDPEDMAILYDLWPDAFEGPPVEQPIDYPDTTMSKETAVHEAIDPAERPTFYDALRLMIEGQKAVRRVRWPSGDIVFLRAGSHDFTPPRGGADLLDVPASLFVDGDKGTTTRLPNFVHACDCSRVDGWVPTQNDMLATDWQVYVTDFSTSEDEQ